MPRPKSNKEHVRMRRMLDNHLRRRASLAPALSAGAHLDEDALSAFVEGRLSEKESMPVTRHLVGCGTCRNITAQLVRLDTELGEDTEAAPFTVEEPGSIRRLLADLASRVLPSTGDDAVFAYHAPADDFQKKEEAKEKEEPEDKENG
ncbi:MAG TPA: zf-HC2 domain-containing protein [Pyrinomonadaceae bacterium]|nr:zf-HC2 domain-containing protein [Pyrinomonadaceae bacterium]